MLVAASELEEGLRVLETAMSIPGVKTPAVRHGPPPGGPARATGEAKPTHKPVVEVRKSSGDSSRRVKGLRTAMSMA